MAREVAGIRNVPPSSAGHRGTRRSRVTRVKVRAPAASSGSAQQHMVHHTTAAVGLLKASRQPARPDRAVPVRALALLTEAIGRYFRLDGFLTVSTTVVVGRRSASLTGMNSP